MAILKPLDTFSHPQSYELSFDGKPLDASFSLLELEVNLAVNRVGEAVIKIFGGNPGMGTFEESEAASFDIGTEVEIKLGFNQDNTTVFKGNIVAQFMELRTGYIEVGDKSVLELHCKDKLFKADLVNKNAYFTEKTDSDTIKQVLNSYGLMLKVVDTDIIFPALCQVDETDLEFVLKRIKRNGLLLCNAENKVTISTADDTAQEVAELTHGLDVISFSGYFDAKMQIKTTKGKAWDAFNEEDLEQTAAEPGTVDKIGEDQGNNLSKANGLEEVALTAFGPTDAGEIKSVIDAVMIDNRITRVRGKVSCRGLSAIKLADVVKLNGFGKHFTGNVLVTALKHKVDEDGFVTEIGFGLEHDYFHEQGINIQRKLNPIAEGLYIGTVMALEGDPLSKNRIKVKLPVIDGEGTGIWAFLAAPYLANEAGFFMLPELDSQVIVGYLGNDARYPVVLGGITSKSTAAYTGYTDDNFTKAICTKAKLIISFDDDKKVVQIKTPGENVITVSDADKGIKIEDQNGNIIQTGDSGITINSPKTITISADQKVVIAGQQGVEITGAGGSGVVIEGLNTSVKANAKLSAEGASGVDINSSAVVNVKGAAVNIN